MDKKLPIALFLLKYPIPSLVRELRLFKSIIVINGVLLEDTKRLCKKMKAKEKLNLVSKFLCGHQSYPQSNQIDAWLRKISIAPSLPIFNYHLWTIRLIVLLFPDCPSREFGTKFILINRIHDTTRP